MGEDQDAAGARGLDEAHRGDRLAGAGRMLEPEALVGVGVVGRLVDDVLVDVVGPTLLVLVLVLRRPRRLLLVVSSSTSSSVVLLVVGIVLVGAGTRLLDGERPSRRDRRRSPTRWRLGAAARSACPRARRPGAGSAACRRRGAAPPRESTRSRPSSSDVARGATRRRVPRRRRRARPARRRARGAARCPGASASPGSSPG